MPHDFYGVPNNEMSRKLMFAFSDYEVSKLQTPSKRGGKK
jgi:hypothetical protein